ncbi:MAG: TolC family outer membrane protein [Pseudomonadota bacterium]
MAMVNIRGLNNKKPILLRLSFLFSGLFFLPFASAQPLVEIYEATLSREPTYLSAVANVMASQERSKQAFSALMPQLTASMSTNINHRTYTTYGTSLPPDTDQYNSNSRQLNFTQPVWRHANNIAVSQAESSVKQAQHQLITAEQELAFKLVSAWCELMAARDTVTFAVRQLQAAEEELRIAKRGAARGMKSEVTLEEVRTKYDQAIAEHEAAEADLNIKLATLEQLSGTLPEFKPRYVSAHIDLNRLKWLKPEPLNEWISQLEQSSPAILAAAFALQAVNEEVHKQRSGHEPTLEMVGSYGVNKQNTGNFPGQNAYKIDQKTLGLQLTIPLYSGGGQNAKIGEALAMEEKARQDLEAARRNALLTIKQAWFGWQTASSRHRAALQAIKSSKLAIKASLRGIKTGIKVEQDHLEAQQKLERYRRDLSKAFYDMALATFRLKATLGKLHREDIAHLDQMFSDQQSEID